MKIKRVLELLNAEMILEAGDPDVEIQAACSSDLMSDLLCFAAKPGSVLITGLINPQVVRTAEIAELKAIIFVLKKRPDKDTIALAKAKGIPLIVTPLSRFTSCGRLYVEGLESCTEEAK